jgi:hypothetical protein
MKKIKQIKYLPEFKGELQKGENEVLKENGIDDNKIERTLAESKNEVESDKLVEFQKKLVEKLEPDTFLFNYLFNNYENVNYAIYKILINKGYITEYDIFDVLEDVNVYLTNKDDSNQTRSVVEKLEPTVRTINVIYHEQLQTEELAKVKKERRSLQNKIKAEMNGEVVGKPRKKYESTEENIFKVLLDNNIPIQKIDVHTAQNGRFFVDIIVEKCDDLSGKKCYAYDILQTLNTELNKKLELYSITCPNKDKVNNCTFKYKERDKYSVEYSAKSIERKRKQDSYRVC